MRRWLVTGAADGIGRALAGRACAGGASVLGVDVDPEAAARAAAALAGTGSAPRFLLHDLADAGARELLARALEGEAPFDVVVHNAGTSSVGPFEECDLERQRLVVELNLVAPLELTARLLAAGRVAPGGTLVFVSSLSRFVGYPGAAVYAATKDGLAAYARSLRVALAPRGPRVLVVYPGPTRTAHARRFAPPGAPEARRMDPDELAERVWRALERNRRVLVPGTRNRIAAAFGLALPRLAERVMRRAVYEPLRRAATRP